MLEPKDHKVIAFINCDCKNVLHEDDYELLAEKFSLFDLEEFQTFKLEFYFDPIYNWFYLSYRIPDRYGSNKKTNYQFNLSNILTEAEIKTLSYFDYMGEKIYGILNQEENFIYENDCGICNSSDLFLFTQKLLIYLSENELLANHERTVIELEQLNMLSKIAAKYGSKIYFLDGYFWQ